MLARSPDPRSVFHLSAGRRLLASIFFALLCAPTLAKAQLAIDPFPDKLVIQRHSSFDAQSGSIVYHGKRLFSGTTGDNSAVEGRLLDAANGLPASPWQVIDAAPSGGVWTGSMADLPAGGWYRLEIRQAQGSLPSVISNQRFGVGVVVLTLGQSNMARIFTEDAQDGSPVLAQDVPHDLTWRLGYGEPPGFAYERPSDVDHPVTWGPVTGSGGVRLANRLQSALGVPVLVLDLALDWTGIDAHWNEQDGPFEGWSEVVRALDAVREIGAVVWAQGAYDAVTHPQITSAEYGAALDTLYSRLNSLLGDTSPPFGIVTLNRGDYRQDATYDASFHAVRRAQEHWVEERSEGFAAGSALDIDLSVRPQAGLGHFWATGYELLADRMAASLHRVLVDQGQFNLPGASLRGATLSQATLNGRHLVVEVAHDQGQRLVIGDADRNIEGFEVTHGAWGIDNIEIERAVLSSSGIGNHVVITLSSVPTEPLRLRYLYGQNPNVAAGGVVERRRRGNWLYDDYAYHPERTGVPVRGSADDLWVTPVAITNLPPVAVDDAVALGVAGQAEIDVLANDADPEGDLLASSVVVVGPPLHGSALVDPVSHRITYQHDGSQPDGSQHGDSFSYIVSDALGAISQPATVTVDLLADDFPVFPGRVLHLETDLGLESDQGGRTFAWRDLSGMGNDLQGRGDALRRAAAINGRPAIELDGQGDKLERTSDLRQLPGGSSDRTVFTVTRYHSNGFGGFAWGSTTDGQGCAAQGNRAFGLIVNSSGDLAIQAWCNDFHSSSPGTGQGWLVQSAKVDSGQLLHYWNGKLIDQRSHLFNTDPEGIVMLGAELDSSPHIDMDVAAVLVYDHALGEMEHMQVNSYFLRKYLGDVLQPPATQDDLFEVIMGSAMNVPVLLNDPPADLPVDLNDLHILQSPQHGELLIDPLTGQLTYVHDGLTSAPDSFVYTVTDLAGQVSEPATVELVVIPPAAHLVAPGLVLHLESDQGLQLGPGDEVVLWTDNSGLANDVTTTSAGPRWITGGLGNRGYLSFDGADDQLSRLGDLAGLPTNDADRSVVTLVRYHGAGFGGVTWGTTQCNGVFGTGLDLHGFLAVQGWCFGRDAISSQYGADHGWRTQTAIHQQSFLQHFADGVRIDQRHHVFNTTANGSLALGRELDGFPFVAMDLAAVLIYDRALSAVERLQVERYLQEKYLLDDPLSDAFPEAFEDLLEAKVGASTTFEVLGNDLDDGVLDPASVVIEEAAQHGVLTLDPGTGHLLYVHNGSASLEDGFSYSVADTAGQRSNPAQVFITLGESLPVVDALVLRLEPHAGTLLDDGDNSLEAWLDLSGQGNDVLAAGRPRLVDSGPLGRPYVRLDGFDDHLENIAPLASFPTDDDDRTLVVVARYHGPGFGGVSYGETTCNGVFGAVVDLAGRLATQGWCWGNDHGTSVDGAGEGWLTQAIVVDDGSLWQYRDGDLIDSRQHNFATAADGSLVIGAELDRSPHVEMDVAAVLIYDRALDETERLEVEEYLRRRYIEP